MRLPGWLLILTPVLWAEQCVVFRPVPENSRCRPSSGALEWPERPAPAEAIPLPDFLWAPRIHDPGLLAALPAGRQTLRLNLQAKGEHVVELFLAVPVASQHGFALRAHGEILDGRYAAGRPRSGDGAPGDLDPLTLTAVVRGPAVLEVFTGAEAWFLAGVRWADQQEYELYFAPGYGRQLDSLLAEGVPPPGKDRARRYLGYLTQLGERLSVSRNLRYRQEGLLAQARAAYWRAVDGGGNIEIRQAADLLERAARAVPGHPLVTQLVSSACRGLHTPDQKALLRGDACSGAEPEPWDRDAAAETGAPAWAAAQLRLSRRAGQVLRWWLERRWSLERIRNLPAEVRQSWQVQAAWLAWGLGLPAGAEACRRLGNSPSPGAAPAPCGGCPLPAGLGAEAPAAEDWLDQAADLASRKAERLGWNFDLWTREMLRPGALPLAQEPALLALLNGWGQDGPLAVPEPGAPAARLVRRTGSDSGELRLWVADSAHSSQALWFVALPAGDYELSGVGVSLRFRKNEQPVRVELSVPARREWTLSLRRLPGSSARGHRQNRLAMIELGRAEFRRYGS